MSCESTIELNVILYEYDWNESKVKLDERL